VSAYTQICDALYTDYGLTPEQALAQADLGQLIKSICGGNSRYSQIQISAFKDRKNTLYKRSGFKVHERLLDCQKLKGGKIASVLIELGNKPIYSVSLKETALGLEKLAFPVDIPLRGKIEKAANVNNLIHCHWVVWVKSLRDIKRTIKLNGEIYKVKVIEIGTLEKWKHYSYPEQVQRFVTYLYKSGIAASSYYNQDNESKEQAYLEWFIDQYELHKLTPDEHRAILKERPKLAWNRNINTQRIAI